MKTSEVEKVCPFCDISFPESAIRKHMGIVHLGLNAEDCEDKSNEVTAVTQTPVETEFVDIKTELTKFLLSETKDSEVESKNELFVCRQCGQAFPTEQGFQEHIEATHEYVEIHGENIGEISPGDGLFSCPQCDKKFKQMNSVYRHQRIVHEKTKFSCRKCGKSFEERRNLITHMEATNHGSKSQILKGKSEHNSTLAPRKRDRPSKADMERRAIEISERQALVQCEAKDRQSAVLVLKRLTSQEIARYINGIRKRGQRSKAKQEREGRNHIACKYCEEKFPTYYFANKHIKQFHEKLRKKCRICHEDVSFGSLKTHFKTVHQKVRQSKPTVEKYKLIKSQTGRDRYQCGQCDRSYAFLNDYRRHVRVKHERSMSFRCDLCDENFTSKFNLKRHNKTYHISETEAKPVVIKLFSRSRGKRASPKGQVQTINDSQKDNFTPDNQKKNPTVLLKRIPKKLIENIQQISDESTKEKSLRSEESFQHLQTMEKMKQATIRLERLSKCTICKMTFKKNDNFKRHIETVHMKAKNFPCEDCGKEFSSKAILTAHTQSTHKGIRFDCNMCDNTFASKTHLRTHVKVMKKASLQT